MKLFSYTSLMSVVNLSDQYLASFLFLKMIGNGGKSIYLPFQHASGEDL